MKPIPLILSIAMSLLLCSCASTPPTTQPSPPGASEALATAEFADVIAWDLVQAEHDAGKLSAAQWADYSDAQAAFIAADATLKASIAAGRSVSLADVESAIGPALARVTARHIVAVTAKTAKPSK